MPTSPLCATSTQLSAQAVLHAPANSQHVATIPTVAADADAAPARLVESQAQVLARRNESGSLPNLMGKLVCLLPNGIIFDVATGFTDAHRLNPPKVGAVVTVHYQVRSTAAESLARTRVTQLHQ